MVPYPSKKSPKSIFYAVGFSLSLLIAIAGYQEVASLQFLDNIFYDFFITNTGSQLKQVDTVVIIDIDDISLDATGQWPWPRYRVANLIKLIAAGHPAVIGLDILFAEPDRSALSVIKKNFQAEFGLDLRYTGIPPGLTDNDGFLGNVLAQSPTVGANFFYFDHTSIDNGCAGNGLSLSSEERSLLSLHKAEGILCNIPAIAHGLSSTGFINNSYDNGVLRKLPLLMEYQGNVYPNLTLASYMQARNTTVISVTQVPFGITLNIGRVAIPIDQQGYALLKFNGPGRQHNFISAVDILNNNFSPERFAEKIVFIGSSAAGMNDLHHTPVDSNFPGVETHAVLIDNILNNDFIYQPSWFRVASLFSVLIVGTLTTLMFFNAGMGFIVVSSLALSLAALSSSYALFTLKGLFLSPGGPLLTIVVLFSLLSTIRNVLEKKRSLKWYKQLANVQQVTLESFATVSETRDPETGAHIMRTQHYAKILAICLKNQNKFTNIITNEFIDTIFISAPLHDIGKIGVPDKILLKPGKLDKEEISVMKTHADFGNRIIQTTARKLEGDNFLSMAGEIAISHHEKWDGSGYPYGLSREEIPLSGRILAVADVYDACMSARCYKPSYTLEKSVAIILEGSGSHFDPDVVLAFQASSQEIQEISQKFNDDTSVP